MTVFLEHPNNESCFPRKETQNKKLNRLVLASILIPFIVFKDSTKSSVWPPQKITGRPHLKKINEILWQSIEATCQQLEKM